MTSFDWLQVVIYLIVLIALVKPLGAYMAGIYEGQIAFLRPVENAFYRLAGIDSNREMNWKTYTVAVLLFNATGFLFLFLLLRVQHILPFNPQGMGAVPPLLAFNTAASFTSNTNWQAYGGETTMSYLAQMLGLGVQNFLSAATGMAVLIALIRGIAASPHFRSPENGGNEGGKLGNFYVDVTRTTLYILLPLALILALALVSQGVVQTFSEYRQTGLLQPSEASTTQTVALGPAASQIAIKQLGTNGGGFFNVNSAHPFENPTPLTNFLEMLAILLIPAALTYTYGKMVGDTRQGWAILAAMTIIFALMLGLGLWAEFQGNPHLTVLGIDQSTGNMEGKEARFGVANSVLWSVATTAASNGSVNSMHASYTPLGGLAPMWLIQLGEIIYGGVGSGLYGMLAFVIVAVFVAGLMVGRTPEYLGKKIEVFEMKMASLMILIPVLTVLLGTALAVSLEAGRSSALNPGAHGFSEILYAFSSAGNNNGSAFAGLNANTDFYNFALGIAMLIARYWLIIPVLAMAGSLAAKKKTPVSAGTLPTHTPLFVFWLIGVILIVGGLSFLPALALGPIVEALL
jgi:K+-transporting ATPase ATPase A chain